MRIFNRPSRALQRTGAASMLALALGLASAPALAQVAPGDDEAANDDDIVVTGTLIRGSAPVGANSVALGIEAIRETGATTANDLLASVPQVSNYFNSVPNVDLGIAANQIQIARPNLRNISPNNASSSGTLILVDGHRIAAAGVSQASIDPDLIPTAAIERVEVVTEGGSATYGADAVAGVINFLSRRRYDGVEVTGR
jgi:iron complex outermembrane recepter protein